MSTCLFVENLEMKGKKGMIHEGRNLQEKFCEEFPKLAVDCIINSVYYYSSIKSISLSLF